MYIIYTILRKFLKKILNFFNRLIFLYRKFTNNLPLDENGNIDFGKLEAEGSAQMLGGGEIGRWTYVGWGSKIYKYGPLDSKVTIGAYCSIAGSVKIFSGGDHGHRARISSYPLRATFSKDKYKLNYDATSKGPIIIGNDVWIGFGATILSGVTIGDGAVIGAGAVISKNVPPYAIVVGNSARVVGYRFSKDVIEKLLCIKWWNWSDKKIIESLDEFYGDISLFINKYYEKIDKR